MRNNIFYLTIGLIIGKLVANLILKSLSESNLTIIDAIKNPWIYTLLIPIVGYYIIKETLKKIWADDY